MHRLPFRQVKLTGKHLLKPTHPYGRTIHPDNIKAAINDPQDIVRTSY
jgi:hypothetical protein